MSQITVHNQTELDAALAREDLDKIIINSPAGVWLRLESNGAGKSRVVARGSSRVEAWGSSRVEAWGSSRVVAWESSRVEAWESSSVVAWESSRVVAWGSSRVEARGSSRVVAWGSSRVEAWGSSSVEAWGSSSVEAGAYVAVHLFSQDVQLNGGVIIDMTQLDRNDPQTWCDLDCVRIADGLAHLYKAVNDSWTAGHAWVPTSYEPGSDPVCDQWIDNNHCGGGLHVCPTPRQARGHYPEATRFVEVTAPVDSIRPIDSTKCKAPTVHVLREVDIDGKPVQA